MYKSPAGMAMMLMSQTFREKLFSSKNCVLGMKG